MKATRYFLNISLILVFVLTATAQNRSEIAGQKNDGKTRETLYKGSYALVIGESEYTNGWDNLKGVLEDVPEVKAALERHGFQVFPAMNLKSEDLQKTIETFIKNYGFIYENRLLIYFAGHGHNLKPVDLRSDMGYIVPVDAPLSKDEIAFKQKAIPMDDILNYAKKIQAKHALFVFDSCFSGTLVSKSEIAVPPFVVESVEKPVRQFITSGAANQTVSDDSVFRKLFVRGLDGEADIDGDGFILGSELAQYLKRELTNYTKRDQTPQYSKILDIDLNQGDFVFAVDKRPNVNLSKAALDGGRTDLKPIYKTLEISRFTQTDICVPAGTFLSITADGNIRLGDYIKYTDPKGTDTVVLYGVKTPILSKYYMETNIPLGALMCRFDYEDKWTYCGISNTLKAEKKGCLVLEVNDKDKTDNTGEYKVTVRSK